MSKHTDHADPHVTRETPGATHDPVCNHWVNPEHAYGSSTYNGQKVHFCSPGCKRAFDADPARFFARHERA